jgi:hypothetical protein
VVCLDHHNRLIKHNITATQSRWRKSCAPLEYKLTTDGLRDQKAIETWNLHTLHHLDKPMIVDDWYRGKSRQAHISFYLARLWHKLQHLYKALDIDPREWCRRSLLESLVPSYFLLQGSRKSTFLKRAKSPPVTRNL